MPTEFRVRLERALRRAKIQNKEFARRVRISPSTVTLWLHGHQPRLPQYERAIKEIEKLEAQFAKQKRGVA